MQQHLELKRPMLEEYEKLLKGKTGTWRAITKKTVMNLSTEVDACVKQMESAQIEYCNAGGDRYKQAGDRLYSVLP